MMKQVSFIMFFIAALPSFLKGQSLAGITHKPDTSYSNYSAYKSTLSSYPYIQLVGHSHNKHVSESHGMVYCTRGNRPLQLDAFYPQRKSNRNGIAIVFIHGGGWRSGNRTQHHPLAQKLADVGYAVFTPEYRLSTEALYPAAVHDVKAAVRWIRSHAKKFNIDPNKMVIAGFSAGGELAAFTGNTNNMAAFEGLDCNANTSSAVQAIIDIDGIVSFVHPESGEGDDRKSISAATRWFGFSKKQNPALWESASALTYAGAKSVPTLFINSSVVRMHAGRDDYIKILDYHHIYTEVHTFEDAPHSFPLFSPWFEPTIGYIDRFLKKIFL